MELTLKSKFATKELLRIYSPPHSPEKDLCLPHFFCLAEIDRVLCGSCVLLRSCYSNFAVFIEGYNPQIYLRVGT